jgi:hypothetical protein
MCLQSLDGIEAEPLLRSRAMISSASSRDMPAR